MQDVAAAEKLITRIRACEGDAAGIALLAEWTRHTWTDARAEAASLLEQRIVALKTYRLARYTYVPAIMRELDLLAAAIRRLPDHA